MSSKPTPLPRFLLPFKSFFMRLPSSSSLLLASLAVSLSSSSLSALAAPAGRAGDGPESLSPPPPVPPHASIPHDSNDAMAQPNGYLQATNLVDKMTAPFLLPPDLVRAIPDILHAMFDPLIGKDAPKARGVPLDVVKHLVSAGKTTRMENPDWREAASEPEPSAPPAAGFPSLPPPQSGPVGRQEPSEGTSSTPDPDPGLDFPGLSPPASVPRGDGGVSAGVDGGGSDVADIPKAIIGAIKGAIVGVKDGGGSVTGRDVL